MKRTAEKGSNTQNAAKGAGSALATLRDLKFTDIRGEFEYQNVYMYFSLNDDEYGLSQFIEVSVMKDGLNQGKLVLPSPSVRSYVKFGATAWVPTEGSVRCEWDRDSLHATGEFELGAPSATGMRVVNGSFDVTVPEAPTA